MLDLTGGQHWDADRWQSWVRDLGKNVIFIVIMNERGLHCAVDVGLLKWS